MSTTTQYKPLPPWSEMPDWVQQRAVDSSGDLFIKLPYGNDVSDWRLFDSGFEPKVFIKSKETRPRCQYCECVNNLTDDMGKHTCKDCLIEGDKPF